MTNITETEALSKVAGYCCTAEHCRAEISEKLQRWGLPYDAIDRILKRCRSIRKEQEVSITATRADRKTSAHYKGPAGSRASKIINQ